jgi:hypothetical protein
MFSMKVDEWYRLFHSENVPLDFCSGKCVSDFFLAQEMIREVTE